MSLVVFGEPAGRACICDNLWFLYIGLHFPAFGSEIRLHNVAIHVIAAAANSLQLGIKILTVTHFPALGKTGGQCGGRTHGIRVISTNNARKI